MILSEIFSEDLKKTRCQGNRRGGNPLRIKVRVADPAGNITVFVTTPVEREKYPAIARQLLAREELKGEQVGFIEKTDKGDFRIVMMLGEFCGIVS